MTQIAVKLPGSLVDVIDGLVASGAFKNRSDFVRYALETLVKAKRDQAIDEAFAEGFSRMPESGTELAEAHRLAVQSINDEPWEPWW